MHMPCFIEPVHGNWTTWSSWNDCSKTCGSGVLQRTRNCSNPEPAFGGDNCMGIDKQFVDCESGSLCPGSFVLSFSFIQFTVMKKWRFHN